MRLGLALAFHVNSTRVCRAAILLLCLALVVPALSAPATFSSPHSIDQPLHHGITYKRNTLKEVAAHVPAERDTNASRMRRGLPPIPPVRRYPQASVAVDMEHHVLKHDDTHDDRTEDDDQTSKLVRRDHYISSGTVPEPVPSASPSATPVTGTVLVVRETTNEVLGMISRSPHAPDIQRYGLTQDSKDALAVTLRSPSTDRGGALSITDPSNGYHYLGFVTGPASHGARLSRSVDSHALLSATDHTASGSAPLQVGAAYGNGLVQSSVWTLDRRDQILTPRWINSDGSVSPSRMLYLPRDNALLMTGNIDHVKSTFDEDAVPVVLRLV